MFRHTVLVGGKLFLLVIGVWCFWQAGVLHLSDKTAQATVARQPVLKTRPIASLRVGERVVARNPELDGRHPLDSTIDPPGWRLIRLVMTKPDGGRLDVELLRPVEWLSLHALQRIATVGSDALKPRPVIASPEDTSLCEVLLGGLVQLDLPELGAEGPAQITSIDRCPTIEGTNSSDRRVITGMFRHSAGNLIDLHVDGEAQAIGVTDNHPFWSEDRETFIPAGELQVGERLRKADRSVTQVVGLVRRGGGTVPVFNLEVDVEHVYFVGEGGVLVHNAYHHPIPKYLGGWASGQNMTNLPQNIHTELHAMLRQRWRAIGFPPEGGVTGSRDAWLAFMRTNAGSQGQAFDVLIDVSADIDLKHGTSIVSDLISNLKNSRYLPIP